MGASNGLILCNHQLLIPLIQLLQSRMTFALVKTSSVAAVERQSAPTEEPLKTTTAAGLLRAAVFEIAGRGSHSSQIDFEAGEHVGCTGII